MAKLNDLAMRQGRTPHSGRRFYTQVDMALLKHDIAAHNSRIKRGEIVKDPERKQEYIFGCGCGAAGCFGIIGHKMKEQK
ncbi:MAG TPA: hypothetical protein VFM18_17890 [Methanosarcina sp.]|nr:hypothetical protein [Methanosarcina sp.]